MPTIVMLLKRSDDDRLPGETCLIVNALCISQQITCAIYQNGPRARGLQKAWSAESKLSRNKPRSRPGSK